MPAASPDASTYQRMFADFARYVTTSAPLYARLAAAVAEQPELAAALAGARPGQRQPVLLLACVHSLLLGDPAQPLAAHYPNLHQGPPPREDPAGAFLAFCAERRAELDELLATRRTQTNETGRTAIFLPAFAALELEVGALTHIDVGASAGLNLLMGHYDFVFEPGGELRTGSAVTIHCRTEGRPPVPPAHPRLLRSVGLDADPVDVHDACGVRWLTACVWPDHVHRFARLGAALDIAARVGVHVQRGDAVDDLEALIEAVDSREHVVITTSWVLNYLPAARRPAFVAALDRAGAQRDLSWVYAENPVLCPELPGAPRRSGGVTGATAVVLVRWRGGRRRAVHLAEAQPHGRWIQWLSRAPS